MVVVGMLCGNLEVKILLGMNFGRLRVSRGEFRGLCDNDCKVLEAGSLK